MLCRITEFLAYLLLACLVWGLMSMGFWGKLAVLVLGVAALVVAMYYYFQVMSAPWDEWDEMSDDDFSK
jgi:peptidoglycan/LPS O-acetylase OafA/YrhL